VHPLICLCFRTPPHATLITRQPRIPSLARTHAHCPFPLTPEESSFKPDSPTLESWSSCVGEPLCLMTFVEESDRTIISKTAVWVSSHPYSSVRSHVAVQHLKHFFLPCCRAPTSLNASSHDACPFLHRQIESFMHCAVICQNIATKI
jgi:hypothetical protein